MNVNVQEIKSTTEKIEVTTEKIRPYRTYEMIGDYAKIKGITEGEALLKLVHMNADEKQEASEQVYVYRNGGAK